MKIPENMKVWLSAYGHHFGQSAEEVAIQFISKGITEAIEKEMFRKIPEQMAHAKLIIRNSKK